jgi:phospholipid/cholesterol/gamma-HCH transport system substrate-binding protein
MVATFVDAADAGVSAVDDKLTATNKYLNSLGSDKYGGELLPTVVSLRELVQSFNKRSGIFIADTRKSLSDVSQSVNKFNEKLTGPRR